MDNEDFRKNLYGIHGDQAEILPLKGTVPSRFAQYDRAFGRDIGLVLNDRTNKAGRRWKDSQEPGRGAEYFLTSPTPLLHPLAGTFGEEGNLMGTPPPAQSGLPKSLEKVKDR